MHEEERVRAFCRPAPRRAVVVLCHLTDKRFKKRLCSASSTPQNRGIVGTRARSGVVPAATAPSKNKFPAGESNPVRGCERAES